MVSAGKAATTGYIILKRSRYEFRRSRLWDAGEKRAKRGRTGEKSGELFSLFHPAAALKMSIRPALFA